MFYRFVSREVMSWRATTSTLKRRLRRWTTTVGFTQGMSEHGCRWVVHLYFRSLDQRQRVASSCPVSAQLLIGICVPYLLVPCRFFSKCILFHFSLFDCFPLIFPSLFLFSYFSILILLFMSLIFVHYFIYLFLSSFFSCISWIASGCA